MLSSVLFHYLATEQKTARLFFLLVVLGVTFWTSDVFAGNASGASAGQQSKKESEIGWFGLNAPNASIVVAVIALFGTAVVGGVGALVTWAMNVRTTQQKRIEERRLRLDTFMNAVRLMQIPEDRDHTLLAAQRAGTLFVLSRLGHLDFALELLKVLWPSACVSPACAVRVLDCALRSGDAQLQEQAASLLRDNASRLLDLHGEYQWPLCVQGTLRDEHSFDTREALLIAILKMVVARPKQEWIQRPEYLVSVCVDLYAFVQDKTSEIRVGATSAIMLILESLDGVSGITSAWKVEITLGIQHSLADLKEEMKNRSKSQSSNAEGTTHWAQQMLQELHAWMEG